MNTYLVSVTGDKIGAALGPYTEDDALGQARAVCWLRHNGADEVLAVRAKNPEDASWRISLEITRINRRTDRMTNPAPAPAPPFTPSAGDVVRWVKRGQWRIRTYLDGVTVELEPADDVAIAQVAYRGDGDGTPAYPRTQVRWLRPVTSC